MGKPEEWGICTLSKGSRGKSTVLINIDQTPLKRRAEICARALAPSVIEIGSRILIPGTSRQDRHGGMPTQTYRPATVISYVEPMGKHVLLMPSDPPAADVIQLTDLSKTQYILEPSTRPIDQLLAGAPHKLRPAPRPISARWRV